MHDSPDAPEWLNELWPEIKQAVANATKEQWKAAFRSPPGSMSKTHHWLLAWRGIDVRLISIRAAIILWWRATNGENSFPTTEQIKDIPNTRGTT